MNIKRLTNLTFEIIVLYAFFHGEFVSYGQSFQNGDLDGTIGFSTTPLGWLQVPFDDPVSNATSSNQATSDLTGLTGPGPLNGINGNPYSGNTFTSGLHSALASDGSLWREGIMQNVTGLVSGEYYQINFYQAVVKQTEAADPSGSWSVFADATLLGITLPTYSIEPFNSNSFSWELRSIIFQATSNSHLIKFLPTDDDPNLNYTITPFTAEGVRMGIDSVSLILLQIPPQINIGSDTTLCEGESLILNANCSGCTYLWQGGSTSSDFNVTQNGTYWVQATNSYGTNADTINVLFTIPPAVNLGADTVLCNNQTIMLDASSLQANEYLWQDGSTQSNYLIQTEGIYWIELSNNECQAIDSIIVDYIDLSGLYIGQDTILCDGETLTLDTETANATYLWQDNSVNSTLTISEPGTYWVEVTLNNCSARDTIIVYFNPIPNAPIVTSNSPLSCLGDVFLFESDSLPNGYYTWTGVNDFSSNTAANSLFGNEENQGIYEVNVLLDGCLSPSSYLELSIINLTTIDDFDFPNVITANGDGINDELNIESYFHTCEEFKFSIFDRWGILIYEYSNGGQPFIGKSMNSNELMDGVYFYILSSKEKIKNGYIHIIH